MLKVVIYRDIQEPIVLTITLCSSLSNTTLSYLLYYLLYCYNSVALTPRIMHVMFAMLPSKRNHTSITFKGKYKS